MRRRDSAAVDDSRHQPFALPGLTPVEACWLLIEASALSWAELMVLEAAATDEDTILEMTRQEAAGALARWRGPIREAPRLIPLPHWNTAYVRGGAPFDSEQRAEIAAQATNIYREE